MDRKEPISSNLCGTDWSYSTQISGTRASNEGPCVLTDSYTDVVPSSTCMFYNKTSAVAVYGPD